MASRRTKSISTKVTPEEYARLAVLAGDETISEWTRGVLLRATAPNPATAAVLAELLALRAILLNLHFAVCRGEAITPDTMQQFIARADTEKHHHADDHLRAITTARRTS